MLNYKRAKRERLLRILVILLIVEFLLIGVAVAIKPAVRAIPGRYRSLLPEPIQRLADRDHPNFLPTPNQPESFAIPTFPATALPASPTVPVPTKTPLSRPPTREPDSTISPIPSVQPTLVPSATPSATVIPDPVRIAHSTPEDLERGYMLLSGVNQVFQLWNNCGPATLTMAMSFYGWEGDQVEAATFLKPDQEDKNVSPSEMIEYAKQQGLEGVVRYGGDIQRIRQLLLAGFPVIVETGFDPEPEELGWMGHYLLIVGYDEFSQSFTTMDSYLGPERSEPYIQFDEMWKHFNRTYLVIFPSERRSDLADVLGDEMDPLVNAWNTLAITIEQVRENPDDAFEWFNLGSSYARVEYYDDAVAAYDQARALGLPWRMLWYQFGPYEAYFHTGRYQDVFNLAEATLLTTLEVEETYYYMGLTLEARGDLNGARAAYQQAVKFNPNFVAGIQALAALSVSP